MRADEDEEDEDEEDEDAAAERARRAAEEAHRAAIEALNEDGSGDAGGVSATQTQEQPLGQSSSPQLGICTDGSVGNIETTDMGSI